jgi:hypothetical protein
MNKVFKGRSPGDNAIGFGQRPASAMKSHLTERMPDPALLDLQSRLPSLALLSVAVIVTACTKPGNGY